MNNSMNKKKICFVIMGFGKKTDPSTGKTLDLDKTYKNIIQPAVNKSDFECVRADEIQDSGLIDSSMYALLIQADLVIADISTYNPNAIYELGIRHAVRPFSTIVLKEKEGKIPFDLDHTRIFTYTHLGDDIGTDESVRCIEDLASLIHVVSTRALVDSPLYEYVNDVTPPKMSETEYERIIGELAEKEKHIFAIVEKAKYHKEKSEFTLASKYWRIATQKMPTEPYFIQQLALCTYKSQEPSENSALTDALSIIEELHPTNDPETLGITGAIYKRLFALNSDIEYLNRAIDCYGKGFKINNNYYTGENYALCLNIKAKLEQDEEERIYLKVEAKKVRLSIIETLSEVIKYGDILARPDKKWVFASIAHCYLAMGKVEDFDKFEKEFLKEAVKWEEETYQSSKTKLIEILK